MPFVCPNNNSSPEVYGNPARLLHLSLLTEQNHHSTLLPLTLECPPVPRLESRFFVRAIGMLKSHHRLKDVSLGQTGCLLCHF